MARPVSVVLKTSDLFVVRCNVREWAQAWVMLACWRTLISARCIIRWAMSGWLKAL